MRYAFLENTADAVGATRIATAHNADDNAETVLLHLVRGAGARGLGGIPPVRGRIIRPVLCLTRAEIQAYLESHGLPHVEDSTNAGDNTPRNVIRHHVMPVLRAINPRLSQGILTAGGSLARDEACLSAAAEKFVREQTKAGTVSVSALEELPEAVAARVVRLLCPKAEACHVRSVLALCASPSASGQLSLPDMTVRREYDVLSFGAGEQASIAPVILIPGSTYQLPAAGLSVAVSTCVAPNKIYKTFNTFLFKKERVCGNIIMRCRAPGDRIDCGGCGKDLKKLFIERRIPRSRRALTPVFADDRGVLAVYGIGTDRRVQCAGGEQAIRIEVKELGLTDEK
jgi:tRNA(Ile)-lysidine synthase